MRDVRWGDRTLDIDIVDFGGLRINTVREDIVQELNQKATMSKAKETPLLTEFSRDLTEAASRGQLDPLIGRDSELERTIPIQISLGEGFDVGKDVGSAVDFNYSPPFAFTGGIEAVTVDLR